MKLLNDAWQLALKDLRSYFRDRIGLLLGFLMPIALITVFGVVMAYAFGGSGGTPKISMSVLDLDNSAESQQLVDGLLSSEMLKTKRLTSSKITNPKEAARQLVRDGDAHHVLIIESGYAQSLRDGDVPTMTMLRDPGRQLEEQIIQFALMQELISLGDSDLIFASLGKMFRKQGFDEDQWDRVRESFALSSSLVRSVFDDIEEDSPKSGSEPNSAEGPASQPQSKAPTETSETNSLSPSEVLAELLPIETEDISRQVEQPK